MVLQPSKVKLVSLEHFWQVSIWHFSTNNSLVQVTFFHARKTILRPFEREKIVELGSIKKLKSQNVALDPFCLFTVDICKKKSTLPIQCGKSESSYPVVLIEAFSESGIACVPCLKSNPVRGFSGLGSSCF